MNAKVPIDSDIGHVSVLLGETLDGLAVRAGGHYVDGTFGLGGHTRAILERADCSVVALDRDPDALKHGESLKMLHNGRLTLIEGCFGDMEELVRAHRAEVVDGVALDLGVSSPQLVKSERGFSFRVEGPLDMRMGRDGPTAADVVNGADEGLLADIIYKFGEERQSRRIAKAIVLARNEGAIRTTTRLAEIVRRVASAGWRGKGIDPATRTFQALRIHVNDELSQLDRGLAAAERLLAPGGRLVVISFHSLEDRRVKSFLRLRQGLGPGRSRHAPPALPSERNPSFEVLTRKPIRPSASEIASNPKARSARLRIAERTAAPAWEEGIPS